jgi:hypothetical protein
VCDSSAATKKEVAARGAPAVGIPLLVVVAVLAGCAEPEAAPPPSPEVPRGFSQTLQVQRDGQLYRFGPFVGYYFRPVDRESLSRLQFICFNEDKFYSSDMPAGARLFVGEAVLRQIEPLEEAIPKEGGRIRPVFFNEAPSVWLGNRPEPQNEFVHFHSTYNAAGRAFLGYWLRHRAVAAFTYDMGGRVDESSPLWHRVREGPDLKFPRIIEFDFGKGINRNEPKGRRDSANRRRATH